MSERITDKLVKGLTPPPAGVRKRDGAPVTGQTIIYDDEIPGFGVRITSSGARSFVLNYRVRGKGIERRLTIGQYPAWTVAAARDEAKALRKRVDRGEDPLEALKASSSQPTLAELAKQFLDEYAAQHWQPRTIKEAKGLLGYREAGAPESTRNGARILDHLGKRDVADLTRREIEAMMRAMSATPTRANRAHSLVRQMLNQAMRSGRRPDNPALGIKRFAESGRARYLSPAEINRLSRALGEHPDQDVANVVRLLILTGARRTEVLSARWDQFDLEQGIWTKPSGATKQRREHRVPLSGQAIDLLRRMRKAANSSPLLFPGRVEGQPVKELKRAWKSICKRAELDGVRVHDLRHSFASLVVSAGASLPVVGALLGHSSPATTARYAHLFDDALRRAADGVGAIVAGKRGARMVPMRRRQ